MSVPSDTEGYSTQHLVEAGEILRTLSPPTFASLHLVIDYEVSTQAEMAEIIGCVRPSISKYLQSLENLPVALVRKQGHDYSVTTAGERVFGLMDDMLHRLGTDLRSIDWSDEDEQDEVADCLTPLYDSRSTLPFLLLDSIRALSGLEDVLGTPQPVEVADVINAVSIRKQELVGSVSAKQVRRNLQRFNDKGDIEFDGARIRFLTKGQEHAWMMYKMMEIIDGYHSEPAEQTESGSDSVAPPSQILHDKSQSEQGDDLAMQLAHQRNEDSKPTIVAAYCLLDDGNSQPRPVLPLPSLTTKELDKRISHLLENYGEDAQLEPYWTVQTESGLHPVYPAAPQQRISLDH